MPLFCPDYVDAQAVLPDIWQRSTALASGDIDQDGDRDLFIANDGLNRLYVKKPYTYVDGTFGSNTGLPLEFQQAEDAVMFDADGDGDLDIAVVNSDVSNAQDRLLINSNGLGKFTDGTFGATTGLPADDTRSYGVNAADVNGDGALDLLIAHGVVAPEQLLINDGAGHFQDESARLPAVPLPRSGRLLPVDVDADEDLDIYVARWAGFQSLMWINDGTGQFVDETAQRLPVFTENNQDAQCADFDLDGDLDIYVGISTSGSDRLLVNDGHGFFTAQDLGPFRLISSTGQYYKIWPRANSVDVGDVNGTGYPDVVITSPLTDAFGLPLFRYFLLQNKGNLDFVLTEMPLNAISAGRMSLTTDVLLADGDLDGDLDFFAAISLSINSQPMVLENQCR